ncbi:hypothetical protein WR25_14332 isoform C [Diploscapter pachys]|nr:hypothetical protein WR25_14332 isoform C [Diploscapter pachys]
MGIFPILSIVVGVEAVIGNATLIFVLATGCKNMLPSFKYMQYLGSSIRLFYTIGFALTAPTIHYVAEEETLLIVQGFAMDKTIGKILLCLDVIFTTVAVIIPCTQFVHRYFFIVVSKSGLEQKNTVTWITIGSMFFVTLIIAIIQAFIIWPSEIEEARFHNIIPKLNVEADTAFIVISFREFTSVSEPVWKMPISGANIFGYYTAAGVILFSITTMIICGYLIRKNFATCATQLSDRTIKMQRQLQTTLIIQTSACGTFFAVPFGVAMLGPCFGIDPGSEVMYLVSVMYLFFPASAKSRGSSSKSEDPYKDEPVYPCKICGRKFIRSSLEKHESACRKLVNLQRKTFDSGKQRAHGSDLTYEHVKRARQEKQQIGGIFPRPKTHWRERHESFIDAVSSSKKVDYAIKTGAPLPPPPRTAMPSDYVHCDYCGRNFSEQAAERHIPFCREQHSRRDTSHHRPGTIRSVNTSAKSRNDSRTRDGSRDRGETRGRDSSKTRDGSRDRRSNSFSQKFETKYESFRSDSRGRQVSQSATHNRSNGAPSTSHKRSNSAPKTPGNSRLKTS